MRFRLWGTRGSIPSPARAETIEAKLQAALSAAANAGVDFSNPTAVRAFISSLPFAVRGTAGGDTACVEVRSAGNLLVFDCGSGLRQLGMELMKQEFGRGAGVVHIFMSHTHWDHMMGWPFFVPAYIPGNRIIIYGVHPDVEQRFRLQQTNPSMFPISLDYHAAEIEFVKLKEGGSIRIGQTRISNIRLDHPGDAFAYRVEDDDGALVYATDGEYKSLEPQVTRYIVEFFRDADVLIFDAMFSLRESYQKEDWGHSSALAGADLATRGGVRRLLMFHHDPYASDEQIWKLRDVAEGYLEQHPERSPCEVIVAYDGFEMELWREATLAARSERLPEGVVVHLSGRLVSETTSVALAALDKASTQANRQPMVVCLKEVNHIDQDGVTALFEARRRWRPLAVSCLSAELQRTFAWIGALPYFAVFDTPESALAAITEALELQPGQLLNDRYKVNELVQSGNLGDHYRATDQTGQRQVGILVICRSLGSTPTETLMAAARSASRLRHPLIADILEAGQDGSVRFLTMEYTAGRSLRQILSDCGGSGITATSTDSSAISPAQAVHIAAQIAQALAYAHSRNSAHGGLAPENIILIDDGSVKLTNFGVARIQVDKPLTELPAHMGSLDYLAPEQIQGSGDSRSSDLYALGAILYEMLTGQPPFAVSAGFEDLISLQLRQPPVPPRRRNAQISRSLEHLILNLLQKRPLQRPSSASAVRQALVNLNPQLYERPLRGREGDLERLRHHLERVVQGQSGMLIVHGKTGTGKSQLVLNVAREKVAGQTLTTLYGELFAYADNRPYKLFVDVLRRHLLQLPAHQLAQLLRDLGDLARPLTVLIRELQPALTAFSRADVDCQRLEEAVCETLRLLTEDEPVLLILDSLQWIDASSLHLVNRLARQRIPRLLVVVLYRSEEVGQDHPLRQALTALEPWIDEQIRLQPLGPIEVHQMASTLNAQVPSDFGLWLYSTTDGNPLYIEQLIQAYLEGPGEARHPLERSTGMTLEDAILRRLEPLPSEMLTTLRQAAVLGHHFPFDRLRMALDQPERTVLDHLDAALQVNLIHGHPSEDRYSFSHPLVREVIYSEMLGGVRKRYHWRAAYVLEQEGVSGLVDEKVHLLAHHCVQAGDNEKALNYLARAIRRARQLCAYQTAFGYVDLALNVVDQLSRTATSEHEREQRRKQRDDLSAARDNLQADIAE